MCTERGALQKCPWGTRREGGREAGNKGGSRLLAQRPSAHRAGQGLQAGSWECLEGTRTQKRRAPNGHQLWLHTCPPSPNIWNWIGGQMGVATSPRTESSPPPLLEHFPPANSSVALDPQRKQMRKSGGGLSPTAPPTVKESFPLQLPRTLVSPPSPAGPQRHPGAAKISLSFSTSSQHMGPQ